MLKKLLPIVIIFFFASCGRRFCDNHPRNPWCHTSFRVYLFFHPYYAHMYRLGSYSESMYYSPNRHLNRNAPVGGGGNQSTISQAGGNHNVSVNHNNNSGGSTLRKNNADNRSYAKSSRAERRAARKESRSSRHSSRSRSRGGHAHAGYHSHGGGGHGHSNHLYDSATDKK